MLAVSKWYGRNLQTAAKKVLLTRNYWQSGDHNLNANQQAHRTLVSVNSAEGDEKALVSRSGDNSPSISPLLTLGTNKRPIFPGYLSAIFLKDEIVIDAVMRNKEKEGGYLGVFLRTDELSNVDMPEVITNESQIHKVGTFAQIQQINKTDFGTQLILMGHRRINFDSFVSLGPPAIANVTHWKKPTVDKLASLNLKAYTNEVMSVVRELVKHNPLLQEMLAQWVARLDLTDPYRLADFATALTSGDGHDLQRVLEASQAEERMTLVLELLTKEKELVKLQREISKQVEEKVSKSQREYFLREQLKSIKQELGLEKDDKDDLVAKYRDRIADIQTRLPADSEPVKLMTAEVRKLEVTDRQSSEYNVIRSYLDWLVAMPWGRRTQDRLDIQRAKGILDEDHYGMDEVKKRILEFIAVGKLKGSVAGKILCFVGPPGVGKTSIAKSIARSLDRKFYRFSVGGLTDPAEIKGHRRTYVGAMPGKPVQCLRSTECVNPLILIDEIDKVGHSHQGDPSSALLELLDPNQNASFVDHYLDIPTDFSSVLFVCTANDEGAIPGPLRDRMEMIRLTGYDMQEKVAIASRYLVPKCFADAGLVTAGANGSNANAAHAPVAADAAKANGAKGKKKDKATVEAATEVSSTNAPTAAVSGMLELEGGRVFTYEVTEAALEALVRKYSRESGVRSLEKFIERVARKLAFSRVQAAEEAAASRLKAEGENGNGAGTAGKSAKSKRGKQAPAVVLPPEHVVVTPENLEQYAGKPVFTQETIYSSQKDALTGEARSLPVGVVMGLAWDPMGGSPIFIEAAAISVAYSETGGGMHMVTGQLGSVMKESVSIAYTFARQYLTTLEGHRDSKYFNSHQLHLHVPEGAVSKDGPSAGVAMTTSLISMATGRPVNPQIAMTGEISLTGKVLPVGGIKEKSLAARRAGATAIILPAGNRRDYDELPQYVREHLQVHYASEYSDVFKIAFGEGASTFASEISGDSVSQ